jgi:hypothetical protein
MSNIRETFEGRDIASKVLLSFHTAFRSHTGGCAERMRRQASPQGGVFVQFHPKKLIESSIISWVPVLVDATVSLRD